MAITDKWNNNKLFGDWGDKKWLKEKIDKTWNEKYDITTLEDKYKDNSIIFSDVNENKFINSGIGFELYRNGINEKYGKNFKHFGKSKKYPCIINSRFKDGKSGAAYYHKFNYNVMKKECKNCGQPIYSFEQDGKTINIIHVCNKENNKILPASEIK